MAAEVSADLALIQDEDTLRRMWAETEDFGKKKEIRQRMYKLREQRLRDFYTTGEVVTEITGRKHIATTHADSIADQGFMSMKSKEIRDSESPTRDFNRRNNYWSSQKECHDTTGEDDGAHIVTRMITQQGHGVINDRDNTTRLALSAQNVRQSASKADDNSSFKSESKEHKSQMASSTVSQDGSKTSSSQEKSAKTEAKSERTETIGNTTTTKWSSSSSSSKKTVTSSSQSYQISDGDVKAITNNQDVKAITVGEDRTAQSASSNQLSSTKSEAVSQEVKQTKATEQVSKVVESQKSSSIESEKNETKKSDLRIKTDHEDSTTDQKIMNEIQKLDTFLSTQQTPGASTPASPSVTDSAQWTVVSNKGGEFVYQVEKPELIKHPNNLELPKEATEGQYVTTYQQSYKRISVDNSPSHEYFARTLRDQTPSPTKFSSKGSLDRCSPERKMRSSPSLRKSPEKERKVSQGSYTIEDSKRKVSQTKETSSKSKRKLSSTQAKIANKTRVSTPGASPSTSPTRKQRTASFSDSDSDVSNHTYNKANSTSSLNKTENTLSVRRSSLKKSSKTDTEDEKYGTFDRKKKLREYPRSDTDTPDAPESNLKRLSGKPSRLSPREKSPDFSSEGSVSRELKALKAASPVRSAFQPIKISCTTDFITSEQAHSKVEETRQSKDTLKVYPRKECASSSVSPCSSPDRSVKMKSSTPTPGTSPERTPKKATSPERRPQAVSPDRPKVAASKKPKSPSPERRAPRKEPLPSVTRVPLREKTIPQKKIEPSQPCKGTCRHREPIPKAQPIKRETKAKPADPKPKVKSTVITTTTTTKVVERRVPSTTVTRVSQRPSPARPKPKEAETPIKKPAVKPAPKTTPVSRVTTKVVTQKSVEKKPLKPSPAKVAPRPAPAKAPLKTPARKNGVTTNKFQTIRKAEGKAVTKATPAPKKKEEPSTVDAPIQLSIPFTNISLALLTCPGDKSEYFEGDKYYLVAQSLEDEKPPAEFYAELEEDTPSKAFLEAEIAQAKKAPNDLKVPQPKTKGGKAPKRTLKDEASSSEDEDEKVRVKKSADQLSVIIQHPKSSRESSPEKSIPRTASEDGETPRYADFISEPEDVEIFDASNLGPPRPIPSGKPEKLTELNESDTVSVADRVNKFLETTRKEETVTKEQVQGRPDSVQKAKKLFETIAKTQTNTSMGKKIDIYEEKKYEELETLDEVDLQPKTVEVIYDENQQTAGEITSKKVFFEKKVKDQAPKPKAASPVRETRPRASREESPGKVTRASPERKAKPESPSRRESTDRSKAPEEEAKPGKFGVTLRRTSSTLSTKLPGRKPSAPGSEKEIEEIFQLELLEEMLLKAVAYEERRRIRAQIRVVKKQIEESTSTVAAIKRRKSSSPSPRRAEKAPESRKTPERKDTPYPSTTRKASQETIKTTTHQDSERKTSETVTKIEKTQTKTLRTSPDRKLERSPSPPKQRRESTEKTSRTIESVQAIRRESLKSERKEASPERRKPSRDSPDRKSESRTIQSVRTIRQETKAKSPERKLSRKSPERRTVESVKTVTHTATNGYQKPELLSRASESKISYEVAKSVRSQTTKKTSTTEIKQPCPTDPITSSYGVGPTDENGRPLFGLKALRRSNTNKTLTGETEHIQTEESVTHDEVDQEVSDVKGRPLFGLKALKAPEDPTMPAQPSPQLKDLVEKHQQFVLRETSSSDGPRQKPKAKFRDSFISTSQDEDILSASMTSSLEDASARGLSLKSIIQKHEDNIANNGTNLKQEMRTTSTVIKSQTTMSSDGKVSHSREVIKGEISAKNGEEPVGRVTKSQYTYQSPEEKDGSPAITSTTTTSNLGQRRRSSGVKIQEIEDTELSEVAKLARKFSKDYSVEEVESTKTSQSRRSSSTSETVRRSSQEEKRSSAIEAEMDETINRALSQAAVTKLVKLDDKTPAEPEKNDTRKTIVRGDSVRALQHKFQQATEAANQPRSRPYPPAGLILRSNSLPQNEDDEEISSSLKQTSSLERTDSKIRSSELRKETGKASSPVTKVSSTVMSVSKVPSDSSVGEGVTMETSKTVTQVSSGPTSFLDNNTKVTGVQDVLERMRNANLVVESEDTAEDAEARALLNKFLGASVILQGMEAGMRAAPHAPSSAALVSQAEKQRVAASSARKNDDIEDIADEKQLRILLEACSDYEARRKIRARLRNIMAEQKGGDELALTGSDSSISGNQRQESSETNVTTTQDGDTMTRTEVTTRTSTARLTKANSVQSPFAKFKQLERQNSAPSAGRGAPMFKFTEPKLVRSASTIKERLLNWVQAQTREYKNIQIENFSTSWSNGLAFCALIHHFCPEAFDYDSLTPQQRRYNFELAFRVADEVGGIAPLLDVEDMVTMRKPDWKCVFTYVQTFYRRYHDSPLAIKGF